MAEMEYRTLIKEMPVNERPRERLEFYGAAALSNAELLAIALRTGSQRANAVELANQLLTRFRDLRGLVRASVLELCEIPGIGPAKATQIKAALELGRRLALSSGEERLQIKSPEDAANLLMAAMGDEMQEQLRVLLLDSKYYVLRMPVVYVGNVNTAIVRMAEVFRDAIKDNSVAIIVAHNHPSGDPTPSREDIALTEDLVRAGALLGISVLDHLVIGKQRYISLKERGLGFR